MSHNSLLQELAAADTPEKKAAIVADAVMKDFPPKLARVARCCGFLPWFSADLLTELLGPEKEEGDLQKIIDLPFIESTSLGYCFHLSTHRGLLQKYRAENPSEIISTFHNIQSHINSSTHTDFQSLITSLYGYVITNHGLEAERLLFDMASKGQIKDFDTLSVLDEAEEFCVAETTGLTPNYWYYRASIFLLIEDFESTIRCTDNALVLDNTYYQAYSLRSIAQAKLGNFEDAFKNLNKAIKEQPDEVMYRSRASIYLLQKDYKNSIFDFTRALRINPKDIQTYLGRANAYLLNKKEEQAFRDLDSALNLSNDTKSKNMAYTMYAQALVFKKEFQKALALYTELIRTDPATGTYRRMGNVLFQLKELGAAKDAYNKSLELDVDNQYAYLGRGKVYLLENEYDKAIADFEKALDISKDFKKEIGFLASNMLKIKEVNLRLWEAYLKTGNIKESEKQKQILLDTQEEAVLFELLLFCRKYRLFHTMLEVGEKHFKSEILLEIDYIALGYALNQLGNYEDAIRYFEQEHISLVLQKINLGVSYWGLNKYETAMNLFAEANKELNKLSAKTSFNSTKKRTDDDFSERTWLKVMFGNSKAALHAIDEYLKSSHLSQGDLYDLRDWGTIIKRSPNQSPEGFEEFYNHLIQILRDIDENSIYELSQGI